ncbi:TetR/AcrR family transcriptional regulator [[Mycobacterium] vasticus]|uniref:TetR/AcrR family transcriptional regulator n=1 Tax=[Mycobacterium] vasticus TaxID=2875777 RepID=A0ABU5YYR3_9MYCO|nr:TetR/AcrR family transcriptional regulator [Mycolicibacter sp. MYC017]MEB3070284.1 TetR/AcrR family transcriptional regulator [Mycolicibacter sp. MYC017]
MTTSGPPGGRGSGRPRDPDVDRRILEAAILEYGDAGYDGLVMERVAQRAGVSKATLYLRWSGRDALLLACLGARDLHVAEIDTGSLRSDLRSLATSVAGLYFSDYGRPTLRLVLESQRHPVLAAQSQKIQDAQVMAARSIMRRAIQRGEIPADTPVSIVLDGLCGALLNHALSTPRRLEDHARTMLPDYIDRLVEFVLAGSDAVRARFGSAAT